MLFKKTAAILSAVALAATPTLAAAANPAASLSVTKSVRASAPTNANSRVSGGSAGIYAILILAGIAAIVIVDATKDDSRSR